LQRFAAYRIHQSLVQKPLSIDKFWPLRSDKKITQDKIVMDNDMMAMIIKAHGLDPKLYMNN